MKSRVFFKLALASMLLAACSSQSDASPASAQNDQMHESAADAGQERYCAGCIDKCWNTTHLIVGLVPGEDADTGGSLATVTFEADDYKGPGGSCQQTPPPETIGVICTATLGGTPKSSRNVTITVTSKDGRSASKAVEESPFNYCGWDIAYQLVEVPTSGPLVFRELQHITPCEMQKPQPKPEASCP